MGKIDVTIEMVQAMWSPLPAGETVGSSVKLRMVLLEGLPPPKYVAERPIGRDIHRRYADAIGKHSLLSSSRNGSKGGRRPRQLPYRMAQ